MTDAVNPFDQGKLAAAQSAASISCSHDITSTEYDEWQAGYDWVEESDEDGERKLD